MSWDSNKKIENINLVERPSFDLGAVADFAKVNLDLLNSYKTENKEEQPGVISTMTALHLYKPDLKSLKILDMGCGLNAPVDRLIKKEGTDLIGCDENPGVYEEFLSNNLHHEKRGNVPAGLEFPIYNNLEDIPSGKNYFDAVVAIRFFGFPLLRRDGQKTGYSVAKGEPYVDWLENYDLQATKSEYLKQLQDLVDPLKKEGIAIFVFQPNLSFNTLGEEDVWNNIISVSNLNNLGFKVLKNRQAETENAFDNYYGSNDELKKILPDLASDWRETVILQKT
ncbi:hypothetical protein COX68_03825 [Candidatus Falkowbacteria bacterium CG_4_10_14_0_2_um_filter_41_15]|uniref:Methyltransferase type 11 domain-containing protein n=3 Tax=Candidatus Falkowiibacteriota TaxID=1752728 RepID=A0A2M7RXB5_9BACT|nr:MAG: hypothetical protein COY54_02385 [Candidatus Falkowbacteria bacterium CG_4_10_14_0_8_um_filter_41_36]PJA08864.1 MAG: hypothetical protein COX68_03825 [Candidatus Falkowbacteria bacterium CG_4_10_14_0_2_um_filter_41_15]